MHQRGTDRNTGGSTILHRQRANTNSSPNAATSARGHARAISDRHNRAVQHASSNTNSSPNADSNCHCYHISHTDCFTVAYCNTHAAPNANGCGDRDTHTYTDTDGNADADTHGHTDSDPHSDANADSGTHRNTYTKPHAIANRNTGPYRHTYSHGDSDTAAKHRRATRGPRRILRRDQRRQLDEQRRLALRPTARNMARRGG